MMFYKLDGDIIYKPSLLFIFLIWVYPYDIYCVVSFFYAIRFFKFIFSKIPQIVNVKKINLVKKNKILFTFIFIFIKIV